MELLLLRNRALTSRFPMRELAQGLGSLGTKVDMRQGPILKLPRMDGRFEEDSHTVFEHRRAIHVRHRHRVVEHEIGLMSYGRIPFEEVEQLEPAGRRDMLVHPRLAAIGTWPVTVV
jgi:hypothetical protein